MSLRIKLPLFTALFVLLVFIAVLSISIHQLNEKKENDIQTLQLLREQGGDVDDVLAMRISQIRGDTKEIIRERVGFSLILLFLCSLAIFFFSKIITGPINRLVAFSEQVAGGRKSYSERIDISSHDEIGRLTGSINTLLHHIERTIAEAQTTAEKYRELIESANSAIVRVDNEGIVLFFNEYAQRLFEYAPERVIGRSLSETFGRPPEDHSPEKSMAEQMKSKTYVELEHRAQSGRYLWVGWTIRPIADRHNTVREYLCVGSDISERRKIEKFAAFEQRKLIQTDKMATLGILAAGIAHEINNPNNFIILNSQNFSQIWKEVEPVLDRYVRDHPDYSLAGIPYAEMKPDVGFLMQGITDGARRIKHIVDSLKDFARQDTGDFGETIDVAKTIEAAQLIASNLIKKATNHFTVDIRGAIPFVRGNFQRLEQVVINLIANACQATDDAEKPIVITVTHQPESHKVAIAINDRGAGITPENMKNIFDPFFTTNRESGGTGLGLAIAYSIIKDHGGELKIDSTVGRGTTATIMLPVA
ncbi:MAG: PAS domain S-box protein [Chitinispirillaceae bacterium]|nr:PAS domain S-box protein [Chitinispirillaceae bacterium]